MPAKAEKVSGYNPDALYKQIGTFLRDQRLDPTPSNYAFAYHVITEPQGSLAKAVEALTEGGIRLSRRDIESLGSDVTTMSHASSDKSSADGLVARTQMQVEGFEDMMRSISAETAGFGRDLEASAAALRETRNEARDMQLDSIVQITAGMRDRVHHAENQLQKATSEASELRAKLEEARNDARHDPLTSLPNRRAIEDAYESQIASGGEPWVAICDIDYFKAINDRFGHAVGDRVLKAIASTLAESCSGHMVARYGGEEFAVMFTGLDGARARSILDQAREAVRSKRYRLRESDEPLGEVTFSAGLARATNGEGWTGAYQRADQMLYRAKEEGRNRVLAAL
tara:strand:- start:294 stop:1319 length:1026 start_codon:yes stop_codon:yes gene_type:complete